MMNQYRQFHLAEYETLYVEALHNLTLSLIHHAALTENIDALRPLLGVNPQSYSVYLNYKLKLLARVLDFLQAPTPEHQARIQRLLAAVQEIDPLIAADDQEWIDDLMN